MNHDEFFLKMQEINRQPPPVRHFLLRQLHTSLLPLYIEALRRMTPDDARQPSSDGRSLAQVAGHIAEWDRWVLAGCGEMLGGAALPLVMLGKGYRDLEGTGHDFAGVDDFNAFLAQRHAAMEWASIQALAVQTAEALYGLFTLPRLLTSDVLEATAPFEWRATPHITLSTRVGWYLWMVQLDHQFFEHSADLGFSA